MRVPDLLVPANEPQTVDVPAARDDDVSSQSRRIALGTLLAAALRVPRGSAWFRFLGLLVAVTWSFRSFVSGPIPFQLRDAPMCGPLDFARCVRVVSTSAASVWPPDLHGGQSSRGCNLKFQRAAGAMS